MGSRAQFILICESHPLASELEQFYPHFRIVTHTRQADAFARRVMKDAIEVGAVVIAGTPILQDTYDPSPDDILANTVICSADYDSLVASIIMPMHRLTVSK